MGYKAIARLAANPGYYYARVIQKAMKGVGTDEETVIRHIVNTSEVRTVLYTAENNLILRFVWEMSTMNSIN